MTTSLIVGKRPMPFTSVPPSVVRAGTTDPRPTGLFALPLGP